ncbi:MAG: ferredoxin [Candidatus Omnitrophica bacterium]|nr:ferredoxin [Candidatus Omnitrophota bacterium]
MPKITIDRSLCTGCGLCASLCPDAFEVGDDNIAKVIGSSCGDQSIEEVASQCPVEAIKVD